MDISKTQYNLLCEVCVAAPYVPLFESYRFEEVDEENLRIIRRDDAHEEAVQQVASRATTVGISLI